MAATTIALAELIRSERETIVDRWVRRVRELRVASDLSEQRVRDHVPALLDRVAQMIEEIGEGELHLDAAELSAKHAKSRLDSGFTVEELVDEHVRLREILVSVALERGAPLRPGEWVLLHRTIDSALVDTLRFFLLARDRKLHAIDRLVSDIAGARDLGAVLDRMLDVFVESVPAADTAAVLICEHGRLVVRGTRGFEEVGFSLAADEGFSGKVAAERAPICIRDARVDELVESDAIRERGVRCLYGVPLLLDDEVIGVAHMGSCRVHEFPEEDMVILRALASRAAALIAQARSVERLEREAELREQLMAIVGHDLRTPLSAVTMGAGHLATLPDLPPIAQRITGRMLRSAERMRRIIEDVLDYTRARAGAMLPVSRAPMRLDDLLHDVVQEIEMAHPERVVELDQTGPIEGSWDPERLRQVLTNLLENAITHGGSAPVRVGVDERGGDGVRLCVWNRGRPIPESDIPLLFEPFRKGVGSPRRGLGLGLFIAREIARAHGGEISVTSDPDRGTGFVVRLPR